MAKGEVSGIVTAFRQSKFKQDSYQTIVDLAKPDHAGELLGARVVWAERTASRSWAGSWPFTAGRARSASGGTAASRRKPSAPRSRSCLDAIRRVRVQLFELK